MLQPFFLVSGKIQVANKKAQFFSFPPKIHQLVAMLLPTCNQKLKWDSMYLIFFANSEQISWQYDYM